MMSDPVHPSASIKIDLEMFNQRKRETNKRLLFNNQLVSVVFVVVVVEEQDGLEMSAQTRLGQLVR